jgi:urease accessory protein
MDMEQLADMNTEALRLVRLLHLASPLLPVGAYSYSQGLESAITQAWVRDEASAAQWIGDVLAQVLGRLEAPVFLRLWQAVSERDEEAFRGWNEWFVASRETRELRAETTQMGHALAALAPTLCPPLVSLFAACRPLAYPAAFAAFAVQWALPAEDSLTAYLWAVAENQVGAAIKAVPLGQTAGQRLLAAMQERCVAVAEAASSIADADLGSAGLGLAIASCAHETQYMRLFRS